jgi:hypothetical protein
VLGRVHDRTLHVVASKTGRARDIDLLAPLAQDLAQWRLLCGRPSGKPLIFPTVDGDEWKRHDWQNWRRRVYRPAAIAAGVTGDLRPYRAARQLRVPAAVGGPFADLCRRAGRAQRGDAGQALRGCFARARAPAAPAGGRTDPRGPRAGEGCDRVATAHEAGS